MDAVINKVKRDILLMLTEETRPDEIEIFRSIKNYFKACMDTGKSNGERLENHI